MLLYGIRELSQLDVDMVMVEYILRGPLTCELEGLKVLSIDF
jgi:hypothetical protein